MKRAGIFLVIAAAVCVGGCKSVVPIATAELVGNPVLIGPVTQLGGARTSTKGGQTFETQIKLGVASVASGSSTTTTASGHTRTETDTTTYLEMDSKSKLDTTIMEETAMNPELGVYISNIEALGRYWWAIAAAGINQELEVQGNTFVVPRVDGLEAQP